MAARGTIAKENVKKNIIERFGENYIGENGGKLYVFADDGGQKVQIAIALTCPKVGLGVDETPSANSFIEGGFISNHAPVVEMTPEEEATVESLLARLGL